MFVAEERSWPRVLERILSEKLGTSAWVGNFGKSGRSTRQHVLDAKYVLPQFSVHAALFFVGINDLAISIDDPAAEPLSLETIQSDPYVRQNLVVHARHADHIKLPKDPKYYYQIHFNDAGSEAAAEIIATELLSIMRAGTNPTP